MEKPTLQVGCQQSIEGMHACFERGVVLPRGLISREMKEGWSFLGGSFLGKCEEMPFRIKRCGIKSGSRLFPDASLVKASAPESRSATQVAPLEISDS